jgi:prepilin signal peptidase PulO-like enzyme (type II secretory pathway)
LLIAVTLWWLLFFTAAGLCIGSFLNVVIYRLPRDRSLRSPLWSACPNCNHRIRWYDNLPIISYLFLRGRCRRCRQSISPRYLIIEAMMAVVVLMLLDAFFIGATRAGLSDSPVGLTERLAMDWPIFTAHVLLFACLLSMSAIDMENYWVDIRFTNFATAAGFVLHALWTPRHSLHWIRPTDTTAVICLMALVGLGLVWVLAVCSPRVDDEDFTQPDDEELYRMPAGTDARCEPISPAAASPWFGWICAAALLLLLIELITRMRRARLCPYCSFSSSSSGRARSPARRMIRSFRKSMPSAEPPGRTCCRN